MHLFCGDGFNTRRVASLVPRGPDLMGERRPIRLEALEERRRHARLPGDSRGLNGHQDPFESPVCEARGNRPAYRLKPLDQPITHLKNETLRGRAHHDRSRLEACRVEGVECSTTYECVSELMPARLLRWER